MAINLSEQLQITQYQRAQKIARMRSTLFSIFLFLSAAGISVGLYLYKTQLTMTLDSINGEIAAEQSLIAKKKVSINRVADFYERVKNIDSHLIDKDPVKYALLQVEKVVLPDVSVSEYRYDHSKGANPRISIVGSVADYDLAIRQFTAIRTMEGMSNVSVDEIGKREEGGNVKGVFFTVSTDVVLPTAAKNTLGTGQIQ